jgi:hypothetical protein
LTDARPGLSLDIPEVAVSSTWVLWTLNICATTSCASEIHAYNRISGQTYSEPGFSQRISLSGGRAVFDQRSSVGTDIVLWDLDNGGTMTVLASGPQTGNQVCCAHIDGDQVVWVTRGAETAHLLNLNGGPPEVLPFTHRSIYPPRIAGSRIAYIAYGDDNNSLNLYLYDIPLRTSTLVAALGWNLTGPFFSFDLSEDIIAWTADADGGLGDVFALVYANLTQLAPTQTDVFVSTVDLEVSGLSIATRAGAPTMNGPFGLTVYQAPLRGPPGDPGRRFPKKPK